MNERDFDIFKMSFFLISKICLLYGILLPLLRMLTVSNHHAALGAGLSPHRWEQPSSGQDMGSAAVRLERTGKLQRRSAAVL